MYIHTVHVKMDTSKPRNKQRERERERERRPGRLFVTLGTGISQADRADLDNALKGENSEEKFPIQNMPGLSYTLLKYIMAEIPPTESHTSGKKKLSFTMMFMSLTRVVMYTILQLVEGVYTTTT